MGMIQRPGLQERLAAACDVTLLTCSDFRLNGRFTELIRRRLSSRAENVGDIEWDIIAHPGGPHRLVRESFFGRESLVEDLRMLQGAHGTETIALLSHENCARYHDGDAFRYPGDEISVLEADLEQSAQILRSRIPGINVRAFIAVTCPEKIQMIDLVEIALIQEGMDDAFRLRRDGSSDLE